jgi:hypothetical protein
MIDTKGARLMLEGKATAQSVLRFSSLPLLVIGAIITNIAEITVAGMFMACIAMLMDHNSQFCLKNPSLVLPLAYTAIFLVEAIPGFFTVILMSRLFRENRALGASVLAVVGSIIWLGWAVMESVVVPNSPQQMWLILPGFICNAIGQVWAAILIVRKSNK